MLTFIEEVFVAPLQKISTWGAANSVQTSQTTTWGAANSMRTNQTNSKTKFDLQTPQSNLCEVLSCVQLALDLPYDIMCGMSAYVVVNHLFPWK